MSVGSRLNCSLGAPETQKTHLYAQMHATDELNSARPVSPLVFVSASTSKAQPDDRD